MSYAMQKQKLNFLFRDLLYVNLFEKKQSNNKNRFFSINGLLQLARQEQLVLKID